MTLQQLHYFLAAIEHGTFSKAAENLHIPQPSLSEQILRLEEHLGTQQKAAKRGRIYFFDRFDSEEECQCTHGGS